MKLLEAPLVYLSLQVLNKQSPKSALISAGSPAQKARLKVAVKKLQAMGFRIFATTGTHKYLKSQGIESTLARKIHKARRQSNIATLLESGQFNLVINVLTGDRGYDQASDAEMIRAICVDKMIPIITDPDIAIQTVNRLEQDAKKGTFLHRLGGDIKPWQLRRLFERMVIERGGAKMYHAHFDKALLMTLELQALGNIDMQKKWEVYRELKRQYTHDDLVERMSICVQMMIEQGITHCRTFVDADTIVKLKCIKSMLEVRKAYQDRICIEIAIQPLEGVVDEEARKWVKRACEQADVIGGLPSRDRLQPEKHLDILMDWQKQMGKPGDYHVDQENRQGERETELLATKTREHGLEGRVRAVHAISLAAEHEPEQWRVARLMKEVGMDVICCPGAAISMKHLPGLVPSHNSIAPVELLQKAGVKVLLGIDNIADPFMPLCDGDLWYEVHLLADAVRRYDLDWLANIVCDSSGFLA